MHPDSEQKVGTVTSALDQLLYLLAEPGTQVKWDEVAAVSFQLGAVAMAITKDEHDDPQGDVLHVIMSRSDARVIEQCLQTGPTVGVRHQASGVLARIRHALSPDGPSYYPH